jgi:hypothetical protein
MLSLDLALENGGKYTVLKLTLKFNENLKAVLVLNYIPCNGDIWRNGGTAPLILNLSTRLR